jgi:Uma2 family endonuclease
MWIVDLSFVQAESQEGPRMSSVTQAKATLDDLHRVEGKAELISGRIVHLMPTGYKPNRVAGVIYRSLDDHAMAAGRGVAFTDNMGFAVPELSSGRQSFSPDSSYYIGPLPQDDMDFVEGPPTLAVEVRSKSDYGASAEAKMAAKRADYFEAGTKVVWDVDPEAQLIRSYRSPTPDRPTVFSAGQIADAERAVPGWRLPVDCVFA